ncbi:MAG: PGPGW domain-containing protein [Desulfuromonadaceae bacterium]|nr:PGPGW domain-containing protein [Desulfuromonadaceae bacterium]
MSPLNWTLKQTKRLIVTIVGVSVLVIGIAMIVLPGPAIVVIPIGLGILATEFVWARNLLHKIKERLPKRAPK